MLTVFTLFIRSKILLLQTLQKQNETDRMCKKLLYSDFNSNILSVKTARIVFRFALSDIIKIMELS